MCDVTGQDGAADFDHWWQAPREWVEQPNLRRGGESGVCLLASHDPSRPALYCKRQTGHIYRSLLHPFGQPTALRELRAYQAIAVLGIRVPTLVYGAARKNEGQWQALLVTEALTGFVSLEQWYACPPEATLTRRMLEQLAVMLARLHCAGWQHGCCYAKHLFARAYQDEAGQDRVETAMLDLEKSRHRWVRGRAVRHDLTQLRRHRGQMPDEDFTSLLQFYLEAFPPRVRSRIIAHFPETTR
ncbi:MAG: phosphotransferase [Candidatus Accumulibacter sp.]|jgi:hypothetical protein|nr:phosphotransferase [Accumulibacter sp.]